MPETPAASQHPGRHEHQDVNVRAVALFGFGLLATIVVVLVAIMGLLVHLASKPAGTTGPLADVPLTPPEPRLQVSPQEDLQKLRAAEDALLNGYGWVDRSAGIVRIPIDRAIELLAQRGLPARSESVEKKQ